MCRLFGMSGGREPVRATFWLLEAPDSLAQQSRREPDGTGLGTFDERGRPVVSKQPLAAYEDQQFAQEAREVSSRTFVAHVRYASTGAVSPENTHPFEQRDRLFAHNGVIGDPERIEPELGDAAALVRGQTDSERFFALITKEIERDGDVSGAIVRATTWIAANLPVFALNVILITATDAVGAPLSGRARAVRARARRRRSTGSRHLDHASARGSMRVRAGDLADRPAVVVASERMDEDPGWRALESGELLHVDPDLNVTITRPLTEPPAHQLTLADLGARPPPRRRPSRPA